jgi:HD superfamily phosphohydrolase
MKNYLEVNRPTKFLNTQAVVIDCKAYQLERILIHDGFEVITQSRWIEEKGVYSNTSKDKLKLNVEVFRKLKKDLSIKAFIIKSDYEHALDNNTYDLYLHVDLFNFEITEDLRALQILYKTYYDKEKNVIFDNYIKDYHRESQNLKYKVKDKLKEIQTLYKIDEIDKELTKAKRMIKKVKALYLKEEEEIQEKAEELKKLYS